MFMMELDAKWNAEIYSNPEEQTAAANMLEMA